MTDQNTQQIPIDWKNTILGDVVEVNNHSVDKDYPLDEIEYIDIASVEDREVKTKQILKLADSPSRARRIVEDDNILISTVRPNLKHFCYIRESTPNLVASTGFAVISSIPGKSDPKFVYYLLTTDEYTGYLTKIADSHTSTYPSFNPDIILNSEFLLPSLPEQRAIAAVLSSFDDKVELLREQNKTLEAIAQTLFNRWFVEFNFPDENNQPYRGSGGKMIDSELGKIPEGWEVGRYENLVDVITGKGLNKEYVKENGKYAVLGANGELGRTDQFLFDEDLVLTGRVGTLGTVYISQGKVWISDNVLISKPKCEENFFYAYFNLKRFNFESLNRGSTQPLITQTDLKNVAIVIPGQKMINVWHFVSLALFNKIHKNNFQIQTLSQLRDTLLPKLMKGELRVKF